MDDWKLQTMPVVKLEMPDERFVSLYVERLQGKHCLFLDVNRTFKSLDMESFSVLYNIW